MLEGVNGRKKCRLKGKQGSQESTLALKPRKDITGSAKRGYQWPTKRTQVLQKSLTEKQIIQYIS